MAGAAAEAEDLLNVTCVTTTLAQYESKRLAKLVAATDHSASICFYFVVHWAREYVGAGSSTSGA